MCQTVEKELILFTMKISPERFQNLKGEGQQGSPPTRPASGDSAYAGDSPCTPRSESSGEEVCPPPSVKVKYHYEHEVNGSKAARVSANSARRWGFRIRWGLPMYTKIRVIGRGSLSAAICQGKILP